MGHVSSVCLSDAGILIGSAIIANVIMRSPSSALEASRVYRGPAKNSLKSRQRFTTRSRSGVQR